MAAPISPSYELTEDDIPGAALNEPLESATMHALKWWLQCRGIQVPSSYKKAQVIERVRKAKADGAKVIDADGSYIYRKYHTMESNPESLPLPDVPIIGWDVVDNPSSSIVKEMPKVTHGLLYTYLADSVGRSGRGEAFRALQRGYTQWSSGRLAKIEVNVRHPMFCHVRCQMTPSMKQGLYHVYILLDREGEFATIRSATCDCAAGKSASCTHISALLHALVSLNPTSLGSTSAGQPQSDEETALPVTSFLCQWNAPKKRKESNLSISEAVFQKHVYGRKRKYNLKEMIDYDPRPPHLREKAKDQLKHFMSSVRGMGIGVSLLFDEQCRCWSNSPDKLLTPSLPSKQELQERVAHFKESLKMHPQKLREIEQSTRDQNKSLLWYSVRRYRITASFFGAVFHHRPETPPQSLALQMLGKKSFTSAATDWGNINESKALEQYQHKKDSGHDVSCARSGFVVSEDHPFLGASPDAVVYDASEPNPFGLVEIKCPYSSRNLTPLQAAESKVFFAALRLIQVELRCLNLKRLIIIIVK